MAKLLCRVTGLFCLLVLFISIPSLASGDDRFALAVGSHDMLVIFGPKGEKVAEIPAPSISQPVTVGTTSFQVSYGRDANDLLTAILTPNPSQPQDLHFNVLNKTVDSDKQAVVSLTFSRAQNRVSIDPGYIGLVHVNSHTIKHHELTDDQYASAPSPRYSTPDTSSYVPPTTKVDTQATVNMSPRDSSIGIVAPTGSLPSGDPSKAPGVIDTSAPAGASAAPLASASPPPSNPPLFWSEPITPPSGSPPHVGSDEMKLVEVTGQVSIKTADGKLKDGDDGMILPPGSTVITSENSSAAVFMGGVNSVRLLPDTDAQFVQHLNGSLRKTTVDLHQGTVFSRVGHRPTETQDYQVRTPEGVAAARGTEFADYRGSYEDLVHGHASIIQGREVSHLLAWNPTSMQHGLISDITNPLMTAANGVFHFVFVANGTVELFIDGKLFATLTGSGGHVGSGSMPSTGNLDQVLQEILLILQPFNTKLQGVIERIDNGTASEADIAYYNHLKDTFFSDGGHDGDGGDGLIAPPLLPPPPWGPPPATGTLNVDVHQFCPPPVTPF